MVSVHKHDKLCKGDVSQMVSYHVYRSQGKDLPMSDMVYDMIRCLLFRSEHRHCKSCKTQYVKRDSTIKRAWRSSVLNTECLYRQYLPLKFDLQIKRSKIWPQSKWTLPCSRTIKWTSRPFHESYNIMVCTESSNLLPPIFPDHTVWQPFSCHNISSLITIFLQATEQQKSNWLTHSRSSTWCLFEKLWVLSVIIIDVLWPTEHQNLDTQIFFLLWLCN